MAVTKEEAMRATYRQEFTGMGARGKVITVRVNGACKTWKTRPNDFRLPVKYGFRECGYIDQDNASDWTRK